jgi:excisionase family DNA binding protein
MSTDREATDLTINQAARRLGVSENAVRQRIKRGTLAAAKVDGLWRITLAEQPTDYQVNRPLDQEGDRRTNYQSDSQTDHEVIRSSAVSPAARAQLEAVRDEWLAPLVGQIREQAEEIGRLRAEREAVERQRDDLATELTAERALRTQIADLARKVEHREEAHRRGAEQFVDVLQRDRDEAQRRVVDLEQRLECLTSEDTAGSRSAPPGAVGTPDRSEEPSTGFWAWWRRLWSGS